jgi:hypothetical protein
LTVSTRKKAKRKSRNMEVEVASENEFNLMTQISEITGKETAKTLGRKNIQVSDFNGLEPLPASRLNKKLDTGKRMIRQIIFIGTVDNGAVIPLACAIVE